jgi:hypothetical protein
MSTIKSLLLALLAASSFVTTETRTPSQQGARPVKLIGPEIIVTSSQKSTRIESTKEGTYLYEVDLAAPALSDTTIRIDDITNSAQPTEISLVVPAGQVAGYFEVEAVLPGDDILTASNANGAASLEVTVL